MASNTISQTENRRQRRRDDLDGLVDQRPHRPRNRPSARTSLPHRLRHPRRDRSRHRRLIPTIKIIDPSVPAAGIGGKKAFLF